MGLGLSVAIDASPLPSGWHWSYAIEDGPKLLGIACWLVYCGTAGAAVLREAPVHETVPERATAAEAAMLPT